MDIYLLAMGYIMTGETDISPSLRILASTIEFVWNSIVEAKDRPDRIHAYMLFGDTIIEKKNITNPKKRTKNINEYI